MRDIDGAKAELVARHGPWTNDSIHLGGEVHTSPPWLDTRLRRITQVVHDVLGGPVAGRRVLDLACLEGQLGIELALHGAEVVAIEGRETNRAKAQFAAEALELTNYTPLLDDVRHVSRERHGRFDIVLCAGILYHLEGNDAVDLVNTVAQVCERAAIIDTHVSTRERHSVEHGGRCYWGERVQEHPPSATAEEIAGSLWYALDAKGAFKFTTDSLVNMLRHAGFTSVFEVLAPYEYYATDNSDQPNRLIERQDRVMLVAIKGERVQVLSSPLTDATPERDRPERSQFGAAIGVLQRLGRKADLVLAGISPRARTFTSRPPRVWRQRPDWGQAVARESEARAD